MGMLDITTNVGCSINCAYCPQRDFISAYTKRGGVLEMPVEIFTRCIDKVPPDVGLAFAGFSEPWLNPDCTKMVLWAYQNGHQHIYIGTTLVGMTVADIDALKEIPFGDFRVHLPSGNGYENIPVDENYLNVLERLRASSIRVAYRYHGTALHPGIKPIVGDRAIRILTIPRSVCVPRVLDIYLSRKKRGALTCNYDRNFHFNELLPNGDVLLCCHDFGMKYVLGNLLTQDYESLFRDENFSKIKAALNDDASNIICRYCLVSRNTKTGKAYFINVLNTDILILMCKALIRSKKIPFLKSGLVKKFISLLGVDKIKIDFGNDTLED